MNFLLQTLLLVGLFYLLMRFLTKGPKKPMFGRPKFIRPKDPTLTMDDQYNAVKVDKKKELDRILGKISKRGVRSLSKKEKTFLDEYSNTIK